MIVVEVELPVEKVPGGSDTKRVSEDRCSTMRGGRQPYNLWTDGDRLVVTVLCPVIESNLYAHPPSCGPRLEFLSRFSLRYKPVKAPKLSRNLLLQGYLSDVLSEGQFLDPFQYLRGSLGRRPPATRTSLSAGSPMSGWFRADAAWARVETGRVPAGHGATSFGKKLREAMRCSRVLNLTHSSWEQSLRTLNSSLQAAKTRRKASEKSRDPGHRLSGSLEPFLR